MRRCRGRGTRIDVHREANLTRGVARRLADGVDCRAVVAADGQSEHPSDVNSSTTTGTRAMSPGGVCARASPSAPTTSPAAHANAHFTRAFYAGLPTGDCRLAAGDRRLPTGDRRPPTGDC